MTNGDEHPKAKADRKRGRLSRKEQKARKKQREESEKHSSDTASNEALNNNTIQRTIPSEEELEKTYVPTPIPSFQDMSAKHTKSLGKWFPKAVVLKSSVHYTNAEILKLMKETPLEQLPTASILLFYQYVTEPLWPQSKVDLLMAFLVQIAEHRPNLGGRIRVAREGLNVTLSAIDDQHNTAVETLRHFCRDLKRFDPKVFSQTDFKFIDHVQADRHFKDLKLFPVQELVFYGFPKRKEDQDPAPLEKTGFHLPPADFHKMLEQDSSSTVVIDVRNHYEAALGRFDGQQADAPTAPGAEYIDPKMRKSTDFAKWLNKKETQEKLQDKNVMLFCTGGVRCERASAYLRNTVNNVKGVFQLQGGVEKYLQEFPTGGYFRGKNFVFDKREACGAGDRDGDGGVLGHSHSSTTDTKCCLCEKPWDRYLGKKKCSMCGVPVLMCDKCMSSTSKKDDNLLLRCPLCVEEGVTVRADDVEWTNNGMDAILPDATSNKAAPSVLKWGGGHAATKKDKRRFQKVQCRFGAECARKDCFFMHPKERVKL
ncbi:hypothetical protein FisN_1Lh374 [Fistulifera solaris]|uniref:Rhodanese domain-containing protein n=1 Tax=Fistulifera solaris TaxID=1519565 RepID=A0A1Z5K3X9_FISSO|nr:hypothetical protein FisN_1Lh374 [Fistulifera solaris]|eukprot:GAX20963.1 hypothetical protein FisN_1Lh374 [Fistulifera solaris]